jgi:hypothetical protein
MNAAWTALREPVAENQDDVTRNKSTPRARLAGRIDRLIKVKKFGGAPVAKREAEEDWAAYERRLQNLCRRRATCDVE